MERRDPKRWAMLALFCVPSITNGVMFLSVGAISDLVEDRFDVSAGLVNGVGQVFYLTFLGSLLSGLTVLNSEDGLRKATIMAGLLNSLGSAIRIPSTLVGNSHFGFSLLVLSNLSSAASQAYFLTVPTMLAASWFPPSDRGVATAIAGLVNQLGMAIGYFTSRFLVSGSNFDEMMLKINITTTAIISLTTVAIYLFFQSGETPQSDLPPEITMWGIAKDVFKAGKQTMTYNFSFFLFVFGVNTAIYWSIGLLLDSSMVSGFSSTEIAVSGVILLTIGIPGMYLGGLSLDKFGRAHHKQVIAVCLLLAASLLCVLAFALWYEFPVGWCYATCAGLGLALGTSQPFFLDLGVLLTPSLSETISSSLLFLFATQIGFVLVFVSTFLTTVYGSAKGGFYNNLLFAGLLAVCGVTFCCYTPQTHVREEEEDQESSTMCSDINVNTVLITNAG